MTTASFIFLLSDDLALVLWGSNGVPTFYSIRRRIRASFLRVYLLRRLNESFHWTLRCPHERKLKCDGNMEFLAEVSGCRLSSLGAKTFRRDVQAPRGCAAWYGPYGS